MNKIKYVFCIGTGRNGSEYLQSLFSEVDDAVAVHEPVPRCNRKPMRDLLNGNDQPMRKIIPEKLASIQALKGSKTVYMETNHCFIKGFGWLLPEFLDPEEIAVIILRRDAEKVRESYFRIGSTCLSENGRNWQIMPNRKEAIVPPPVRWFGPVFTYWLWRILGWPYRHKKLYKQAGIPRPQNIPRIISDYEKESLDWYINETEALTQRYRERFPKVRYIEMSIDELNVYENVLEMFSLLGLKAKSSLKSVVGIPKNLKT